MAAADTPVLLINAPLVASRLGYPDLSGLDVLEARLDEGEVQELILATNPTVEGEVTAHYISELAAKRNIPASRIAHGVPMGSELEYVDSGTLSHAFEGRRKY